MLIRVGQVPSSKNDISSAHIGIRYHFVRSRSFGHRALCLLLIGWKLQAPPFLFHRTTLVALHAINLFFYTHLCLHFIGEHSTFWPILKENTGYLWLSTTSRCFLHLDWKLGNNSEKKHVLIITNFISPPS